MRMPGPGDVWGPINYNCGDPREPERWMIYNDCGAIFEEDSECQKCESSRIEEFTHAMAIELREEALLWE